MTTFTSSHLCLHDGGAARVDVQKFSDDDAATVVAVTVGDVDHRITISGAPDVVLAQLEAMRAAIEEATS